MSRHCHICGHPCSENDYTCPYPTCGAVVLGGVASTPPPPAPQQQEWPKCSECNGTGHTTVDSRHPSNLCIHCMGRGGSYSPPSQPQQQAQAGEDSDPDNLFNKGRNDALRWVATWLGLEGPATFARTKTHIETLRSKLEQSEREVERLRPFDPVLLSLDPLKGEVFVAIAKALMEKMVESFDALNGASNYTETTFTRNGAPAYIVTVQAYGKPTPHELRRTAEADRDRLRKALEPFASAHAFVYPDYFDRPPDTQEFRDGNLVLPGWVTDKEKLTCGHFARARAALARGEGGDVK